MTTSPPGLTTRLALAFGCFFDILGDARFAGRVQSLREGVQPASEPAPAPAAPVAPPPALRESTPDAALQLLALLQREGRFVDFVQEDVATYTDAEVAGAARLVHAGARKVLQEHLPLQPVRDEPEGSRVVLPPGFDAAQVRLTGNVVGQPPFRGTLNHRGWRVAEVRLPRLAPGHDASIVAAAEVEL